MQGPEEGVRRSRPRLREGELEEHERRGGGEEDSGAQGHAESRFPRDLDTALPGEQQPLHQQDHVPGHRGLAQRSSCKVSMLDRKKQRVHVSFGRGARRNVDAVVNVLDLQRRFVVVDRFDSQ